MGLALNDLDAHVAGRLGASRTASKQAFGELTITVARDSILDTLKSWTVMETIVSVVGLVGVLILSRLI